MKCADSAASTRSAAIARLIPPPAAAPRTTLITGASSAASASIPACIVRREAVDGVGDVVAGVVHEAQVAADAEVLARRR